LREKVIFELVQNSELPVTPFSQQTDVRVLIESFQGVQGLLGLKQADRGMFKQLTKPFNVKLDTEDEDDVSNLCLQRLEQMKANLQAGVDDPQELVERIVPPVSKVEPKHKEKADWWSNWLDLTSAQESPQPLRQAAESMYWLHQNLETQRQLPQAMNQGLVAAASQAPAAIGAAALQPAQEQPQAEDNSAELEHEAQLQDSEQQHEAEMKDRETEAQQRVAEIQGQSQLANTALQGRNQLELEKVKGDNAVRTAKAKPKPAARKSA